MINKNNLLRFSVMMLLVLGGLFAVACSSSGGTEPAADDGTMENMDDADMANENMTDMDMTDMEDMDHDHNRIPNENGATITITSPAEGETFGALDQVIVEVEVKNFELGTESHWHVYVDDVSHGMVMGGNTDQALAGLTPGEHEISVYLSNSTHEEYEDGDSVTIVVEE